MRVVALNASKGKSYVIVYENEACLKEVEIKHNQIGFDSLRQTFQNAQDQIVFEATGVYSEPLERFLRNENKSFYSDLKFIKRKVVGETTQSRAISFIERASAVFIAA